MIRWRGEEGLSLVELAIASALSLATLGILLGILWAALRTTRAAQQESEKLEQAQVAMNRLDRDVRGATTVFECPPAGFCVGIHAQLADGTQERIRYRIVGEKLLRERDCAADWTSCAGASEELLDRVVNATQTVPEDAFDCVASRRVELRMLLIVAPLQTIASGGGGTVRLATSAVARPAQGCAL